jgi:hypothetical protein
MFTASKTKGFVAEPAEKKFFALPDAKIREF